MIFNFYIQKFEDIYTENNNIKTVLEWHHRHAIAIGTAKGLRFLHEECRGGPIIHRDMRPSNILLTHDYVPMVNLSILLCGHSLIIGPLACCTYYYTSPLCVS